MRPARLFPSRMRARRRLIGRARGTRTAWPGIGIVWRRKKRSIAPAPPSLPARIAMRQEWSPRVHLHFGLAVTTGPAPRGALRARTGTALLWRRIDTRTSTRLPIVREVSAREWRGFARPIEREAARGGRAPRETGWREIVRLFRVGETSQQWQADGRAAATIVARRPVRRRDAAKAPKPAPPSVRTVSPLRLETRIPHFGRKVGAADADRVRIEPVAAPSVRALDMVWRTAVEERSAETAEHLVRAAAASAPSITSPPQASAWPSSAAVEALRPRQIDPALIERVAEDVIGRVEKRIRIERERRGI